MRQEIKALYGGKITIDMEDLHGEPIDGIDIIQKSLPSSIREKVIEKAIKEDSSETLTIVRILCEYFDNKEKNETNSCNRRGRVSRFSPV